MKSCLSIVFCLIGFNSSLSAQNNRQYYQSLPIEHSGEVEKEQITELAKRLFIKFSGLEDELGVFCTNDKRITDALHEWYCSIRPLKAEIHENGKASPYAPDENQWTMMINLKQNTFNLNKDRQQVVPKSK